MKRKNLTREATFRADSVNMENRTAEFVISNEAIDTYDTVFLSSGWDFTRYQKNPIVTYNHKDWDGDPDLVIGTSEIRIEDKQVIAVVTFEDAENNPLAEKVLRKVQAGILRGASIRADVHEGRWGEEKAGENADVIYFTRQELLAWSVVTVQSTPDALARNTENLEEIKTSLIPVTDPEPVTTEENRSLGHFDAQAIVNHNSNLK